MLQEGERRFPIAVRARRPVSGRRRRRSGRILVTAASGERVPLSRLARIRTTEGPSTINREWGKRRVVVQANVRGRDVGSFVGRGPAGDRERGRAARAATTCASAASSSTCERAQTRLLIVVPLALALIFALLYLTYGRLARRRAASSPACPFAAVGGILALWLRDMPFSISAAVGFVALSGVSVLGELVLVSAIRDLLAKGVPLREAIEQAAERACGRC